jgi:hypothetical protein
MSGHDNLASYSTKLDAWVPLGQSLDAKLISMLTGALQDTASNDLPFLVDSTPARLYRAGTEMGLWGYIPRHWTSTPQTGHSTVGAWVQESI